MDSESPVETAVLAELDHRHATETVEGQVALRLARQLDAPRNGMAVAGDAKALTALLATIREKSPTKADPIDELNARREARGATPKAV